MTAKNKDSCSPWRLRRRPLLASLVRQLLASLRLRLIEQSGRQPPNAVRLRLVVLNKSFDGRACTVVGLRPSGAVGRRRPLAASPLSQNNS